MQNAKNGMIIFCQKLTAEIALMILNDKLKGEMAIWLVVTLLIDDTYS